MAVGGSANRHRLVIKCQTALQAGLSNHHHYYCYYCYYYSPFGCSFHATISCTHTYYLYYYCYYYCYYSSSPFGCSPLLGGTQPDLCLGTR